jgi:hypothetical protein
MQIAKLLGGAAVLIATALVGGTLIGGALAAPEATETANAAGDAHGPLLGGEGEYCDVFLDTFAAELGVSRDDLLPAGKAAAVAAIDAAVEAGDLDDDRAAAMKERIGALEEAGCGVGFGIGLGRGLAVGAAHGFMHADVLEAAAGALSLGSDELIDRLADGSSLEEVAEAEGADYETVKSAVIAAVEADLDAAVAEGLDQDRADAMLERIGAWLDEGGEAGLGRFGHFGPGGPGHRGGPWH